MESAKPLTIRDLYPHLTEEQVIQAQTNLERYLKVVVKVYEYIRSDPQRYAEFRLLTASKRSPIIKKRPAPPSQSN